jgi:ribulose-5-phosphate 4-epimerase/fuculose-1-phosphate aldolase
MFSIDDEGVTHYKLHFSKGKPVSEKKIRAINAWRDLLHAFKWIGQDPKRYKGVGFGNISRRLSQSTFVVSGTQTGRRPSLTNRHYSTVIKSFPKQNTVVARGPVPPSSESMTHANIYALDPTTNVVIHVHAPVLWNNAKKLKLPTTRRSVPYGTPEMAAEVERLMKTGKLKKMKIFAMLGHRDGVVSFGKTADEAGLRLLRCVQTLLFTSSARASD